MSAGQVHNSLFWITFLHKKSPWPTFTQVLQAPPRAQGKAGSPQPSPGLASYLLMHSHPAAVGRCLSHIPYTLPLSVGPLGSALQPSEVPGLHLKLHGPATPAPGASAPHCLGVECCYLGMICCIPSVCHTNVLPCQHGHFIREDLGLGEARVTQLESHEDKCFPRIVGKSSTHSSSSGKTWGWGAGPG